MTTYSQMIDDIKTIIRDSSTTTSNLITSYLRQVLDDIQNKVPFTEQLVEHEMTTGTASTVQLSAYNIRTYDIMNIRDEKGAQKVLSFIPNNIFDEAQVDQSTTDGYPQFVRIKDEYELSVWPYGSDATWKVKYFNRLSNFSATSQTFPLNYLAARAVVNGVVAEMFDWKDDDRATKYNSKYLRDTNALRAQYRSDYTEHRIQPGTTNYQNPDWNRIFGE